MKIKTGDSPAGSNGVSFSDEGAERAVLGVLLSNPDARLELAADIDPEFFHLPQNRTTFDAICTLGATPLDSVTLTAELRRSGELENAGGPSAISELGNGPTSLLLARHHLGTLRGLLTLREQRDIGQQMQAGTITPAEAIERLSTLGNFLPRVTARPLSELATPGADDAEELLKFRFLCRGAGALLVGPTGVGKSAFAMQCSMLWANGRECFGLRPARPLRSLLIQAENDDGDLAEMRDGVVNGLQLSASERERALSSIVTVQEDSHTGPEFLERVVQPLLHRHAPDLLWIDPALAYLGGDNGNQRDVGAFLRNGLNPLLHRYGCAVIIVHHTNKPPSGKEKGEWHGNELAYLGAGSAEWANWARAVIAMRSIGKHDVFELRLGKRGARAGWRDEHDERSFVKHIAHAKEPGVICWREAAEDEIATGGAPKRFTTQLLLTALGDKELRTGEWLKACNEELDPGTISRAKFNDLVTELKKSKAVYKSPISERWGRKAT